MDIKEIIEGVARHYDTSVSDIRASSRDDKTFTAEFLHEESNSWRQVQSGEVIREDNCYGK